MPALAMMLRLLVFTACLLAGPLDARTLPVPEHLISLNSEQGADLLIESEAREAYWPLSIQFVTQQTQAYCGVATIVMVLNALEVPAPPTPEIAPFTVFTQDNFFSEQTEEILPREILAQKGMTLTQIGQLLSVYAVKADVRHAAESSVDEFRAAAVEYLNTPGRHVIVNYLRRAIGQERGGHISPLAAYDADTDRFLILDVSRYKYPPVWVKVEDLHAAMNTPDSDNVNLTRGYVLVSASE